ncbi:MAG: 30S ribosomal protein S2, partial [Treponema sp.]|nr:30S ribosomal protein S2 [Treponema sp.]
FTQIIANAVVEADNEVGLKIIETLGDEDEDQAEMMNDISVKEEDREIDIASYPGDTTEKEAESEEDEEDELPVDVDKVYDEDN